MYEPWEHPRSKVWWSRRRVPARLARFGLKGEIKESLGTKDWDEAVLLCAERNLEIERNWRDLERGWPRAPTILLHRQIVGLAGEFYREMVEKHRDDPGRPLEWEQLLQKDARRRKPLIGAVPLGQHLWMAFSSEIHEFLGKKDIQLVGERLEDFAKEYVKAKEQASKHLLKNANGDYRPDPDGERFGEFEKDGRRKFEILWNEFVANRRLSAGTQKKWKPYFEALIKRVKTDDMGKVTEKALLDWRDELERSWLSPITIRDGYFAAFRSFFGWAKRKKRLATNPTLEVFVEVPEKASKKMRGFDDEEARLILSATLAPFSNLMSRENAAARRWVPWLCAYTGARVNEITQLRREDVFPVDNLWCIRISPEAGTVKDARERVVPLHPHLLEEGFIVNFVQTVTRGPLFYSIKRQRKAEPEKSDLQECRK
jgi:integrase